MERKRIEKLVVLLLIGILMPVSLFPFPVHAETIDTHIRGRNYTYEPITYNEIQLTQNTYYQNIGVFHITFELDDEYIGYVLPNYTIQYDNYFYGAQAPNWGTLSKTFDRRVFVNGSSFSFDISVNWYSISINTAPSGDPFNYDSYTITSSDVTKYADIDSLDQIINILQDNQDIISDIYLELQNVVSNTSLANTFLKTISELRNYDVPIESYPFVISMLKSNTLSDITENVYLNYPCFNVLSQEEIISFYGSSSADFKSYTCIFLISRNIPTLNSLNTYIGLSDGEFINFSLINNIIIDTKYWALVKFDITNFTSSGIKNIYLNESVSRYIVPIYFYRTSYKNISTDFALQYGLSNRLLDSLDMIANGTSQSSSSSVSLDQTTSQFSDDANDLVTIEESFNNSMNQSLQSVNPTFNMGSSFLTSANWVSQQFNRIVNNTPFASLITFGLTLGLGLLIIGKVRK